MINISEFGQRIKQERTERKWTLEYVQLETGISRQTLSRWEKGTGNGPSTFDLITLGNLFDCDYGYLVGDYDLRRKEAADIHKVTGLSEEAIETLIEYNKQPEKIRNVIYEFLDALLDSHVFPSLAIAYQQLKDDAINSEFYTLQDEKGNAVMITGNLKEIAMNAYFTEFVHDDHKYGRSQTRKDFRQLHKEDSEDNTASMITDIEQGK